MLKLTSLPSATVVKIAPEGASALAEVTLSASGNAAAAATISQRMCVVRIRCPPQVCGSRAMSCALVSCVHRPHSGIRAGAVAPFPVNSADRDVDRRLLSLVGRVRGRLGLQLLKIACEIARVFCTESVKTSHTSTLAGQHARSNRRA